MLQVYTGCADWITGADLSAGQSVAKIDHKADLSDDISSNSNWFFWIQVSVAGASLASRPEAFIYCPKTRPASSLFFQMWQESGAQFRGVIDRSSNVSASSEVRWAQRLLSGETPAPVKRRIVSHPIARRCKWELAVSLFTQPLTGASVSSFQTDQGPNFESTSNRSRRWSVSRLHDWNKTPFYPLSSVSHFCTAGSRTDPHLIDKRWPFMNHILLSFHTNHQVWGQRSEEGGYPAGAHSLTQSTRTRSVLVGWRQLRRIKRQVSQEQTRIITQRSSFCLRIIIISVDCETWGLVSDQRAESRQEVSMKIPNYSSLI